MTPDLWITLAVLVGAVVLFVSEKLPVDVVALLILGSLLVFGVVSPGEALSGFSSPATITVAAMFVLSAGLQRSGALRGVGELLSRVRWPWLLGLLMMLLSSFASAFINNTAIVAVFLPLVISAVVARGLSPSKFLIPLSFAAQFGGVCTLIGTSTNLLVDSLARQSGQPGFALFEFASLGVWFVVAGTLYMLVAQRFLLPDLGIPDSGADDHRGRYLVELRVPEKSPAIGRLGSVAIPVDAKDVFLLENFRDGRPLAQPRAEAIAAGDRLLIRGDWNEIERVRRELQLRHDRVARDLDGDPDGTRLHAEVMIAPGSPLAGKSLVQLRFGHVYRVRVHGVQRSGAAPRAPLDHIPLAVGDILLVDATASALEDLRSDPGVVLIGQREQPRVDGRRALLSLLVMAAAIGVAVLGWMPIVASSLLGCAAAGDAALPASGRGLCRRRLARHHPARRRAAAGHRAAEIRRRRLGRAACAGLVVRLRPGGDAGRDLPAHRADDRSDEQQCRGRAGGADRHLHGRVHGRGRQALPRRGGLRRIDQLRHAGGLPDQHHGLHRRRLPLLRLPEDRHPAEPAVLGRWR